MFALQESLFYIFFKFYWFLFIFRSWKSKIKWIKPTLFYIITFWHVIEMLRAPNLTLDVMLYMEKEQCVKGQLAVGFIASKTGNFISRTDHAPLDHSILAKSDWIAIFTKIHVERSENWKSRCIVLSKLWSLGKVNNWVLGYTL